LRVLYSSIYKGRATLCNTHTLSLSLGRRSCILHAGPHSRLATVTTVAAVVATEEVAVAVAVAVAAAAMAVVSAAPSRGIIFLSRREPLNKRSIGYS